MCSVAALLRYNCDGTEYSGCGGHIYGQSGIMDALDDSKCQWYIRVEDGYAIEISVLTFDVSWSILDFESLVFRLAAARSLKSTMVLTRQA